MKSFILIVSFFLNIFFVDAQQILQPVEANSKVGFSIRNFGMNTDGRLTGLKGSIAFDPKNLGAAYVDVTVQAASIDTDNEKRDKHLRGSDYFNVTPFPFIRITGKPTISSSGFVLNASLTIRGLTKQMLIPFKALQQNGGWLFTATFDINRLDFKVGKESMVLSNKVKVNLSIVAK